MNRREFLKTAGAAVAAISLPVTAAATPRFVEAPSYGPDRWPDFNPRVAHGNGLHLYSRPDPVASQKLIETLYADMARFIPPSYRHRVEIVGPVPVDFGQAMSVCWRYNPA